MSLSPSGRNLPTPVQRLRILPRKSAGPSSRMVVPPGESLVANNLTIESPNCDKITKEAGQFTSDAINTLWMSLNDTRRVERADFRRAADMVAPRVLTLSPAASVDNLALQDCSVLSFVGASSQDFTGMRAPDTNSTRIMFVHVSGAGTITVKNNATSEVSNRLFTSTGADVTLSTGKGTIFAYLASGWRQLAL